MTIRIENVHDAIAVFLITCNEVPEWIENPIEIRKSGQVLAKSILWKQEGFEPYFWETCKDHGMDINGTFWIEI